MKKYLIIVLFLLFLPMPATAQTIKINGGGLSTGRAYIRTEIKGHKLTIRSPKLLKNNKYIKLVNVAL